MNSSFLLRSPKRGNIFLTFTEYSIQPRTEKRKENGFLREELFSSALWLENGVEALGE